MLTFHRRKHSKASSENESAAESHDEDFEGYRFQVSERHLHQEGIGRHLPHWIKMRRENKLTHLMFTGHAHAEARHEAAKKVLEEGVAHPVALASAALSVNVHKHALRHNYAGEAMRSGDPQWWEDSDSDSFSDEDSDEEREERMTWGDAKDLLNDTCWFSLASFAAGEVHRSAPVPPSPPFPLCFLLSLFCLRCRS